MTADSVRLVVPGSSVYLRLVRLAAADAATRANFDIDQIEDLRIAVDELCHALSDGDGDRSIELDLRTDGAGTVEVTGRCEQPDAVTLSDLARTIVGAVVDDFTVAYEQGRRTFRLRKSGRG